LRAFFEKDYNSSLNTMEIVTIQGHPKAGSGKVETAKIRRAGQIPAIMYKSGGGDAIQFTINAPDVRHLVYTSKFKMAEITLDGQTYKAILKDIQFHPVTEQVLHLDFLTLIPGLLLPPRWLLTKLLQIFLPWSSVLPFVFAIFKHRTVSISSTSLLFRLRLSKSRARSAASNCCPVKNILATLLRQGGLLLLYLTEYERTVVNALGCRSLCTQRNSFDYLLIQPDIIVGHAPGGKTGNSIFMTTKLVELGGCPDGINQFGFFH